MAGREQNVIYYKKSEEKTAAQTQERDANRHYTNLILSPSRPEETAPPLHSQGTDLDGMASDWWNTGVRHRNRSVSSPIEGKEIPQYIGPPSEREEREEGADAVSLFLNGNYTSFQLEKMSLWSTTFQNSGWLDIYLHTTMTQCVQY